ncbi:PAS domain-containing sensor histidine kinase [Luteitalea sp. TBR-22]|uniref:two-component system sensor histidine kinase NtrB n=1 Tax=Luteitalea sp. TBR-22 TaxID=2802971 RepID=UPI001AF82AA0|nr:ATP-binding protein [Luteitalea sp. TBR-22]BCS34566.1 PAS domain-containing sensor histidine kinase [Luteitalea sp. TBR-22]
MRTPPTADASSPSSWPARPRRAALSWLAGLRALVAVALLAPLAAFTAGQGQLRQAAWLALLPLVPLASSAWGLLAGGALSAAALAVQAALDALVVLAVVWSTGGLLSSYTPLMLLPTLGASVLGGRRAGLHTSLVFAVGILLMAAVQYGWVPAPDAVRDPLRQGLLPPLALAAYTIVANVGGVVATALLVGHLSESLSRTGADLARATTSLADLTTVSQRVIDSLAGGLVVTDAHGQVVLFNRTAETITGRSADEALGQPLAGVLPLPSVPGETGPARMTIPFTRADGTVLELGATVAPLLGEAGQRAGQLVTFQDVTLINQREAERQRQERLAAVGEMAAGIAHEIRNPLASMSGSIQLLRGELSLRDDQATLLDIVMRESQRLNDIIKNFLSYAGPQRVTRARVDVAALVREVGALLRQQVAGATPPIEVRLDASEPVYHDVDEAQVRQVVWNLASNGLKAMPQGGALVIGVARGAGEDAGAVRLWVRDGGIGMAAADVERMFQPFQSGFRQGSGLGLAIVRRIVTDHGGLVNVRSAPGEGTEIAVVLPAPVSQPHGAAELQRA